MLKYLPYILGSVLLNAFAQILIRNGMICVGQLGKTFQEIVQYVISVFTNFCVLSGMFCYGLSFLLWIYVLSKVSVSIAYPLGSIGFILVPIIAFFTLGEPLSVYKIFGTIIICVGVIVLSMSPDAI